MTTIAGRFLENEAKWLDL
jgi:hypothetical protein